MALMNCPECEKLVSELAVSCPNCGCPIAKKVEYVLIKLELADSTQTVSILASDNTLIWSGRSGEVAQIGLEGPVDVTIQYHPGLFDAPKTCKGRIDAGLSRKWLVKADNDRLVSKISLYPVDSYSFKYEYKMVKLDKYDEKKVEKNIEKYSANGWELVSIRDNSGLSWTIFFKRPLAEPMPIVVKHIKP